jgi:hypothetical protein
MATRKVFGTIHDSRDLPWANQRVTFVLRVGSFTSATQYPRKRVEATTNSVGYFEVDLWANSDGLLPTTYQCKLPDADEFDFRLSNGVAPINLSELRGLGGISTQVPQTLLEQLQPYFLSISAGDGRYRKLTDPISFGDLGGALADGQIPINIARIDDVITRIAQHAAASDPHPQYLTPAEGAALFAPAGSQSATNLSLTARTATTLTVSSDTGEDATIPGASTTLSGVMSAADKTKLDGITAGAQPNAVISVADKTGVITLVKADVGLGLADNTADADKPISTATATALAARELTAARTLTPTPTDPGNTATINVFLSWLISAMRGAQTSLGGLGALATKSTIADIDVAAGAAIAWSKISKSGATPADVGAATAAQGALAATALQPASNLDATRLTGTVPIGSIPAAVATDAEVSAAIATVTTTSIGADIAGSKTLTPTATDPGNTATNSGFLSWLISAMRSAQTTLSGLGALATKSTIANIDVAAGAAIAWSKISKSGAVPTDVGAQPAAAKLTTISALTGTTPIRSDGSNGALTAAEIPNLDASKTTTGTFADSQIPASIARDSEVSAAIAGVTTTSIGADIAGAKTLTPTATDPGNTATNSGFLSWLISAVRSIQATLSGLGTLATKSTIVSADITDGTITNADISPTAAIVASKLSGVRPQPITAIYYVSTTGNDTTGDGFTTPTAFATIQRAIDAIAALDGNGQSAIIAPQPGTYAGASFTGDFVGWARVSIAAAAASTVTINSALTLQPATKTPMTVRFLDFIPSAPVSGGTSINAATDLTIRQCTFSGGVAGYNHVTIADGAARQISTVAVSGTFGSYITAQNSPVYMSGSISAPSAATFATFINAPDSPIVQGASAPTTPTGTFTGSKYNAAYNSVADSLIPGSTAGTLTLQPTTARITGFQGLSTAGLLQLPAGSNSVPVVATETTIGAAVRAAANEAALRAIVNCDPTADNYTKLNASITTGGTNTSERWVHIPTSTDNYTRIVVSRSFSDDAFGYGSLSCVISVSNGVWGSAGGGVAITIEKFGDFGWTGAFAGATNHLLREVRLVEGTSTESALSGVWLKLMGARTYKIAGAAGTPAEYATFQPTAGLSTINTFATPRGRGMIYATSPDYNGADFGYEVPLVLRSPNGTRYRVNVDNAGSLSTTVI